MTNQSKARKLLSAFGSIVFLFVLGSIFISLNKNEENIVQRSLKINEKGLIDVYNEDGGTVGYVDVDGTTPDWNIGKIDVKGTLYVYIPYSCTSIIFYEWPNLTIACVDGPTTKIKLTTKDSDVIILADTIDVIKK